MWLLDILNVVPGNKSCIPCRERERQRQREREAAAAAASAAAAAAAAAPVQDDSPPPPIPEKSYVHQQPQQVQRVPSAQPQRGRLIGKLFKLVEPALQTTCV